jgi:hypothetical protein
MKEIYVVGMQVAGGVELHTFKSAYVSRVKAEEKVKEYHADGLTWMKVFTLIIQD